MKLMYLTLALVATTGRLAGDPLYDAFRDPKTESRPFVRWWWNGGRINATELARELDVMKAAGIGGVEINTIGMPDGASAASLAAHPEVPWLSPEWVKLVRTAADLARERGMTADLIVGSGWPFGGRFLEPSEQTQRVLLAKKVITGPTRLTFSRSELLTFARTAVMSDPHSPAPEPTASEVIFARLVPPDATNGAFSPGQELLDPAAPNSTVVIDLKTGSSTLYIGIKELGFTHVKLGAPGADGPVVNHFDAAAVRKYLDHMSTKLAPALGGNLGEKLRAMFVDSLELDHANWTGDLETEFRQRRGYDLRPYLPFVLDADDPANASKFNETVRRARFDFDRTLVELFDARFLDTYVAWCRDEQVKARIQAYGRETHPLDGSLKVDLPEGETWLWVDKLDPKRLRVESTVVNKYVSSAANLTGQRLRSFEAMTNAIPVFRETLQDFKRGFDASIISGLNHPILHGFNYTPLDAGFPGWVRFGSYLNERNPWWPYFRRFSDYAARVGTIMRMSEAPARVAVLAPRPDEWSKHGLLYQPFPEVADPWYQFRLIDAIQQAGYNADYVSEKILIEGRKQDGQLRFGPCAYDVLILEDVVAMDPLAAEALSEFVQQGGRVVFIGQTPAHAPGLAQLTENDARVRAAMERIDSASAGSVHRRAAPTQTDAATRVGDEQPLAEYAAALLGSTGLPADVRFDRIRGTVSQTYQRAGSRSIYFIVNRDVDRSVRLSAAFPSATGQPSLWNPETGDARPLGLTKDGELELTLEPTGSALVVFGGPVDNAVAAPVTAAPDPGAVAMTLEGPWALTLQTAGSTNVSSRTLPELVDLSLANDPALSGFGGAAVYAIEFQAPAKPARWLDLGAVHDISEVRLNGQDLGARWWGAHRYDVGATLRPGLNHLEIRVHTVLVNLMRRKTDDGAAQRWASWAPPIPTGLVGPVRLLESTRTAPKK